MSLLDIPEYRKAVNAEAVARDLAFLPMPVPICGVPVRHMNARHFILLSGCKNRFVVGGRPLPEDVLGFLWFLSPEYSTAPGMREAFAAERVRKLEFTDVVIEIYRYLERVWQDWPGGGSTADKNYTAPVASLVDVLASEYGWRDEDILEMPLARIFQYLRRIQRRHNPRAVLFNQSDRALSEHLQKRMSGGAN